MTGIGSRTGKQDLEPGESAGIPEEFRLSSYRFDLPGEQIAQGPASERHGSRLMVLDRASGETRAGRFPDFLAELGPRDCLVRNVVRADRVRLKGRKWPTGGAVEALLLRHESGGAFTAFLKPSRRLAPGTELDFAGFRARCGQRRPGGTWELLFGSEVEARAAMEEGGELPLPPYIRPAGQDPERYQTVYAREAGGAAAPTAGFHFEAGDFEALRARGVEVVDVVLEVGGGTFQPLRHEDIRDHEMHEERFRVDAEEAGRLAGAIREGRRIVAIGTTSLRVLESLDDHPGWEQGVSGATRLYVMPGHRFRRVDALLTNFHLPDSTLVVLVAAFAGRGPVLRAYSEASAMGFRFFSFGDAMWIR